MNGDPKKTCNSIGSMTAPAANLTKQISILGDSTTGYYLQGYASELRIWSIVRDPDSIRVDYRRRLYNRLQSPGLVWVWRFNEGYGNTLSEYTTRDGKALVSTSDLEWNPDPAPTPFTICEHDCYFDGASCRCTI